MPTLKHTGLSHRHIPARQTTYETDCHKSSLYLLHTVVTLNEVYTL